MLYGKKKGKKGGGKEKEEGSGKLATSAALFPNPFLRQFSAISNYRREKKRKRGGGGEGRKRGRRGPRLVVRHNLHRTDPFLYLNYLEGGEKGKKKKGKKKSKKKKELASRAALIFSVLSLRKEKEERNRGEDSKLRLCAANLFRKKKKKGRKRKKVRSGATAIAASLLLLQEKEKERGGGGGRSVETDPGSCGPRFSAASLPLGGKKGRGKRGEEGGKRDALGILPIAMVLC